MHSAPILAAYSLPDDTHRWAVPCDFCGRLHVHGAAEGHRAAHCAGPARPEGGYVLRFAGPAPLDIVAQFRADCRRREAAFRTLLGGCQGAGR